MHQSCEEWHHFAAAGMASVSMYQTAVSMYYIRHLSACIRQLYLLTFAMRTIMGVVRFKVLYLSQCKREVDVCNIDEVAVHLKLCCCAISMRCPAAARQK